MPAQRLSRERTQYALAVLLIALPAIAFYTILWATAVSLPIFDDYKIVLEFVNTYSQLHGFSPKLLLFLTNQHNGYKLLFEHGVVLCQYALCGKVRILPLVWLGNAFAILIFMTVAGMMRPAVQDRRARAALLIPIAYLIFQLQYASALNFASSSLQHLAVVAFSLLSIYFMSKADNRAFLIACGAFVFAIASSPNGFFVLPVAMLMTWQQRQWRRACALVAVAGSMLGLYLFRYDSGAVHSSSSAGTQASLFHINFLYALSFLGAAAARYSSIVPSVALGLLICVVVTIAAFRHYFAQNAAVFASMLFILINAVAVSGLRADQGVVQSLASRYRIYSSLMLVLSYIFVVENILPNWKSRKARRWFLVAAAVVSAAFCFLSDLAAARFLQVKKEALISCYIAEWQRDRSADSLRRSQLEGNPALQRQMQSGMYNVILPIMNESVRLGIYEPPQLP